MTPERRILMRRLSLAASLIRRIDTMGKVGDYEGESLAELAWACHEAANSLALRGMTDEALGHSVKVPASSGHGGHLRLAYRCNPDESGGLAEDSA